MIDDRARDAFGEAEAGERSGLRLGPKDARWRAREAARRVSVARSAPTFGRAFS